MIQKQDIVHVVRGKDYQGAHIVKEEHTCTCIYYFFYCSLSDVGWCCTAPAPVSRLLHLL